MRRLSCHRKITVKKDYKTILHLFPDYATYVEFFQSFFTMTFLQQGSLLVFHPCLNVSVLFTGPSLNVVDFYRKYFTPSYLHTCIHVPENTGCARNEPMVYLWYSYNCPNPSLVLNKQVGVYTPFQQFSGEFHTYTRSRLPYLFFKKKDYVICCEDSAFQHF